MDTANLEFQHGKRNGQDDKPYRKRQAIGVGIEQFFQLTQQNPQRRAQTQRQYDFQNWL